MRIRQIELVGFKSFREPTRLSFASGMNAIVGPNGCGKSNVADAIRWALGEQSTRHLRAKDMEDVIFAGNAKSAPLNFAEVTLTFEQAEDAPFLAANELEGLAAQVAQMSEFSVTRRIFRSGDSQYFINQAPARLRDITELFLGSGVGPKAYAIIEQGRVGQIVNAKPEELRLFIEEAAGTTRFRSRKIAAERKLERTGENLARVNDVMREIDRQLGQLRRQAKRAEEFRALEAELRSTEIGLAATRFHRLESERARLADELAGERASLADEEGALAEVAALRGAAVGEDQQAARDIEAALSAVAAVGAEMVRSTERQNAARDAAAVLENRIEQAEAERARLADEEGAASRSLAEARARLEEWIEREALETRGLEASQLELDRCTPAHEQAVAAARLCADDLERDRRRLTELTAAHAKAQARAVGLREERERAGLRCEGRQRELELAAARIGESLTARTAAQATHERLAESRKIAAADLRSREEEAHRLVESGEAVREGILRVQVLLDGLRERERALEGYGEGLENALLGARTHLGLVVDALSIPADLEQAVAAVLGDVLRGATVERPEDAVEILETLRSSDGGRLALVPRHRTVGSAALADLPTGATALAPLIGVRAGFEDLRAALFDRVALAEDLPAAVAATRDLGAGITWVTRAGDLVDARGVVTGGRAPAAAGLLERRRALTELAAQLDEDEVRAATIDARLAEVRAEASVLGEELRKLDAEAHEATVQLVATQHAVEGAERDLASAEQRVAEARAELAATASALEQADATAARAEAEAREAGEAVERDVARIDAAEREVAAARGLLEAARSRRDELRDVVGRARESLTDAKAQVSRLEHVVSLNEVRSDALAAELGTLRAQRDASLVAQGELELEVAAARVRLQEREADVEAARERARSTQARLNEVDGLLADARRRLDQRRERCSALDVRLADRAAQLDSLVRFSREQHAIEVATLEAPEVFDVDDAEQRIGELKARIARLGDVNVAAIADARELEERFTFLETQRTDLEASMEDLRRTIAELSRNTRARFSETFEKAHEQFKTYFVELFRGGSASLKLTNPQNLLESGVELEVQPPGKRVGSLDLLSGGERALTAISLLMALFSLRATPFCLLDEVDAPLDEANVGRFNALLQRMSERTQFIIITHNQATMEAASALYGVTMAEAGVSTVVSVELAARDGRPREGEPLALAASA